MDVLYYSNYCKHSQKVIQFLAKNGLTDKMNFICIDKRVYDQKTNNMQIVTETGKTVFLPPNVHSVPALLLVKQHYRVILGDEIIQLFTPMVKDNTAHAVGSNGEPSGFVLTPSNNGMSIVSEQYSNYSLTPEELSAKGYGGRREMYNYVKVTDDVMKIVTPPDTYRPDKLSTNVTVDTLQNKRNEEVPLSHSVAASTYGI
jgi:hypothetical protein